MLQDTMSRVTTLHSISNGSDVSGFVELEARLHLISAVTKLLKDVLAGVDESLSWHTAMMQFLSTLSSSVHENCAVFQRSLAKMIVIIIGDLLPCLCDTNLFSRMSAVVGVDSPVLGNYRAGLPGLCVQCLSALLLTSDHREVVLDKAVDTSEQAMDMLPFRVKQDHIGFVSLLKAVDSLPFFIGTSRFTPGDGSLNLELLSMCTRQLAVYYGEDEASGFAQEVAVKVVLQDVSSSLGLSGKYYVWFSVSV
jgi:hypothetical protein